MLVVIRKETDELEVGVIEQSEALTNRSSKERKTRLVALKKGQEMRLYKESFYVKGSPGTRAVWIDTLDIDAAEEMQSWETVADLVGF